MPNNKLSKQKMKEYVRNLGASCPYCGGSDLRGDNIDVNDGVITQAIDCPDCQKSWSNIYTLTGIHITEVS